MRWLRGESDKRETEYIKIAGLEEAVLRDYLARKFPNGHLDVTLVSAAESKPQRHGLTVSVKENGTDEYRCRLHQRLTREERDEIELLRSTNTTTAEEADKSPRGTQESGDEKNKEATGKGSDERSDERSALGRDEKKTRDQKQSRMVAEEKIKGEYMTGLYD